MCRWWQDVAKLHELRSVCKVWREAVYGRWFNAKGVLKAIDDGGVVQGVECCRKVKRHKACRELTICRGVDIVQNFEHGSFNAVELSVGRLKLNLNIVRCDLWAATEIIVQAPWRWLRGLILVDSWQGSLGPGQPSWLKAWLAPSWICPGRPLRGTRGLLGDRWLEEVVAVTSWPEAQTSSLQGGPKFVATPLNKILSVCW